AAVGAGPRPPAAAPLDERCDDRVAAVEADQADRVEGGRGRVEALAAVGEQAPVGDGLGDERTAGLGLARWLPAGADILHGHVGLGVLQEQEQRDQAREGVGRRCVVSHRASEATAGHPAIWPAGSAGADGGRERGAGLQAGWIAERSWWSAVSRWCGGRR